MPVTIDKILRKPLMHKHVAADLPPSGATTPVIVGLYDAVSTTYPDIDTEVYAYTLAGSAVTTLTFNFTDATKQVYLSHSVA